MTCYEYQRDPAIGFVLVVGRKLVPIEPLTEITAGILEQMARFQEARNGRIIGKRLQLEGMDVADLKTRWLLHPRGKFECKVTMEMGH